MCRKRSWSGFVLPNLKRAKLNLLMASSLILCCIPTQSASAPKRGHEPQRKILGWICSPRRRFEGRDAVPAHVPSPLTFSLPPPSSKPPGEAKPIRELWAVNHPLPITPKHPVKKGRRMEILFKHFVSHSGTFKSFFICSESCSCKLSAWKEDR